MKFYIVLGASIALTACGAVTEPEPETRLAPSANPEAALRHATTPALLSGYVARPVKGPTPWRKLNDQQSPSHQGGS